MPKDNIKQYYNKKSKELFLVKNNTKNIHTYTPITESGMSLKLKSIYFMNCKPFGVNMNGFGLVRGGSFLINELYERIGKPIKLIVSTKNIHEFKKLKTIGTVVISEKSLKELFNKFRIYNAEKNKQSVLYTLSKLKSLYPKLIKQNVNKLKNELPQNCLTELLNNPSFDINNLSKKDISSIETLIPLFFKKYKNSLKLKANVEKILSLKNQTELIFIENIIKEFEKKIEQTLSESNWQEFLRDKILLANTNYIKKIEKKNISLSIDLPDFLMVDFYDYMDIHEIKKPNTKVLSFDKSRKNYYWSTEITKAISQVENYMFEMMRASDTLIVDIKKYYDIDIKIVKPRGFIIAGKRSDLINNTMKDNFRLLNNSLKNIEIILYDDLLNNLKEFVKKFNKPKKIKNT